MYAQAFSIQLISIFLVMAVIGRACSARKLLMLSTALVTPVPVASLTAGVGGLVFIGDLVGLYFAVMLLRGGGARFSSVRSIYLLTLWAAILLIGMPLLSTLLAFGVGSGGDIRFALLGVVRGVLYWCTFRFFLERADLNGSDSQWVVRASVTVFFIYALVGVGQFYFGYNLDYWNAIRSLDGAVSEDGFGGGFMGMYRGAVGAWAAAILCIAPPAFIKRASMAQSLLLLPTVVMVILVSSLLVGSRQGVVIGLLGFILGWMSCFGRSATQLQVRRAIGSMAVLCFLFLSAISLFNAYLESSDVLDWLVLRFGVLLDSNTAFSEATSRDDRVAEIFEKIVSNPLLFIFGVSELSITSEFSDNLYSLIYVDSEILWTLQRIGWVGACIYALFYIKLFLLLYGRRIDSIEPRSFSGAALLVVMAVLTYGHFSLLHVQSSHAPLAYWMWAFLGMAVFRKSKVLD